MNRRVWVYGAVCAGGLWLSGACTKARQEAPPPDAHRPQLKSESELATERAERIREGTVVPTSAPAILAADRRPPAVRRRLPSPIKPADGAIEGEILLVNEQQLTTTEVLYPLREQLAEARRVQTEQGFREQATRMLASQTQQEIGRLLVYADAIAELEDRQREVIDEAVERSLAGRIAREFGGSSARLSAHLEQYGMTLEQYRERLKRAMVVSQYTREKLLPQVYVRRAELLEYYQRNTARYSTPGTRELLLIEAPFASFLPEGVSWESATEQVRARARLDAVRHIREAQAALAETPFDEVARKYSRGLHAANGGSWGPIGQPLRPPYDTVSRLIFEFEPGQCSEPVEAPNGWYIVKCGRVVPEQRRTFGEVQEEIRQELMDEQLNELSVSYIMGLAEKATMSSLDQFVMAAVRRAATEPWTTPPQRAVNPAGSDGALR